MALGVDPKAARDYVGPAEPIHFEVEQANWLAVRVFLRCGTQWRRDPHGALTGIDYSSLETVMRLMGVDDPQDVFERVAVIEDESLRIIRKN